MAWILAITGCGPSEEENRAAAARKQEIERLRQENEELANARTENEEVQRLKQANQELPKFRNLYQEAARLRKENDQWRQQIAKISPTAAAALGAAGSNRVAGAVGTPLLAADDSKGDKEAVEPEGALHEGDDILVEPKDLKSLLPDFDWEKLGRKEPVAVRALLEKDGVQITNISQLKEMGLTNFVVQKAIPPPQPAAQGSTNP